MDEPTRISPITSTGKETGRRLDPAATPARVTGNDRDSRDRDAARPLATIDSGHMDLETRGAVQAFLALIGPSHAPVAAWLYGSWARGTHSRTSDVDVAVIMEGRAKNRYEVLGPLSDAAFDVLMETGIHVHPLPLWEDELERPESSGNPALIEAIKRDGIPL